jgi:RNase H-fold protein (predicted Holliday junction resolvase)
VIPSPPSLPPGDPDPGSILAVDPGRDKCGLAVVAGDGQVRYQGIVPTAELAGVAARLAAEHGVAKLIVGDRTAAREVCRALAGVLPLTPVLVDEHRSSERARQRFFQENPRRGWRRLLPVTLQTPDRPYDDYVAVMLAERHLEVERQGRR